MIKTKHWILIFSAVLTVCAIVSAVLFLRAPKHRVVQILQDGKCIQEIDLDKVTNPYTFTITDSSGGSNTIRVEHGRICILSADCPDQVCVHRGWLSDSAVPIVCIPHRLVIQMADGEKLDSMAE